MERTANYPLTFPVTRESTWSEPSLTTKINNSLQSENPYQHLCWGTGLTSSWKAVKIDFVIASAAHILRSE